MTKENDDLGVWRTIGGRRVFIKKGQSLEDAMKESGKFKKKEEQGTGKLSRVAKNQDLYKKLEEEDKKEPEFLKNATNEERANYYRNLAEKEKQEKMGTTDYLMEKQRERGNFQDEKTNALQNKADKVVNEMSLEKYNELYDKKVYDEGMSEKQFKKLYGERPTEEKETLNAWQKRKQELLSGESQEAKKDYEDYKALNKDSVYDEVIDMDSEEMKKSLQETKRKADEWRIAHGEKPIFSDKEKGVDWRAEVKKNNDQLNKETEDLQKKINELRTKSYQGDGVEKYRAWQEAEKLQDEYYEKFRENERRNAKIKKEEPTEPYEYVEAYAGYKRKFNDTWGQDGSGNNSVSAKMYTNDEFMEHLEDANWHGERRQLLEANLTNQELSYIKDRTKVSAWGVDNLTGKEQTQKLIDEAKAKFGGGNQITNALKSKAYENYKKQHPHSKMTFEEFKNR